MEIPQRQANMKPTPPRKPLTPYMRFSKSIWQSVKVSNPNMSVCEIGATIGKMWRELTDEQKQKFNEDFASEKAKYDEELAQYLKITGLQASDLVKSKSKKKDSNKNQNSQPPTPPMMAMQNAQMAAMHHMAPPGYPGNAGHMMAPPGFSQGVNSSVAGALPHFSQIWASSPYEQNMQMNLMMNAHQNMMEGRPPNGQHQFGFGAHVSPQEQVNSMSPLYNGSPQMSQSASPHMHSPSPLSGQQSTTPNTEQQMQHQFEAMRENGGQSSHGQQHGQNQPHGQNQQQHGQRQQQAHNQQHAQPPAQQNTHHQQPQNQHHQQSPHSNQPPPHGQHNQPPHGQGHGQHNQPPHGQHNQSPHGQAQHGQQWPWPGGPSGSDRFPSDQNGHHSNGTNGMNQPPSQSFESQQPGSVGSAPSPAPNSNSRPPSVAASDHMDNSNSQDKKDSDKPPTPEKPQPSPGSDSNQGPNDTQKKPETPSVMSTTLGASTTAQAPFPTYPSAHNVFNSFENFNQSPWAHHASRQSKDAGVFNRESILETELSHLRSALSEKTKEVQRLTQELDKAHGLIQQLQAEKLQH